MIRFRNFALIIIICLAACKRDPSLEPDPHFHYIIYLTKDLKILNLEYYTEDSLTYKQAYNYLSDRVEIKQTYKTRDYLKKSIYYLNAKGLADSCVDSMFYQSKLSQMFRYIFTYDNIGYKTAIEQGNNKNIREINNGNAVKIKGANWNDCSSFYGFNNMENKLDIEQFLGDFNGKHNTNLMIYNGSDCHPGSGEQPPSSTYDYTLDSAGFVIQRTEIFSTYAHHKVKAKNTRLITNYFYKFQ